MFRVKVTPEGREPFEVQVTTRDGLRWEQARSGRSIGRFSENPTLKDLYSLTYIAVQRSGLYDGDIRAFEQDCDLERRDDDVEEDPGPTRPAP